MRVEIVVGAGAVDDAIDDGVPERPTRRADASGRRCRPAPTCSDVEPAGVHLQATGLPQVRQPGERRLGQAMPMHVPVGPRVPEKARAIGLGHALPERRRHAAHEVDRLAPVAALGLRGSAQAAAPHAACGAAMARPRASPPRDCRTTSSAERPPVARRSGHVATAPRHGCLLARAAAASTTSTIVSPVPIRNSRSPSSGHGGQGPRILDIGRVPGERLRDRRDDGAADCRRRAPPRRRRARCRSSSLTRSGRSRRLRCIDVTLARITSSRMCRGAASDAAWSDSSR